MRGSKAGLADLNQLHEKAQAARKDLDARAQAARALVNISAQEQVLTEDARQLFARATQTVQPIQAKGRVMHAHSENPGARAIAPSTRQSDKTQLLEQKRLRATDHFAQQHKAIAGKPQSGISDIYTPIKDTDTDIAWSAPGIGPDTLRKLKQAFWPVGAQLDLHGMNSDQARPALLDFISRSQQHGTRCVRIIHGQGYGSVNGHAVLKNLVTQWLAQITGVSCFTTAPQSHGGRGALLALIKQV
jgi:DNA-nicking Smr family endonuclease